LKQFEKEAKSLGYDGINLHFLDFFSDDAIFLKKNEIFKKKIIFEVLK
jgi:hypothetical protein